MSKRISSLLIAAFAVLATLTGCESAVTSQEISASGARTVNTPSDMAEFSVDMIRNEETGELEMGAPKIRQVLVKNTPTPIMADNESMWIGDTGPASTVIIPGWGILRVAQDGEIASIERPVLDENGDPHRDLAGNPIVISIRGLKLRSSPVVSAFDAQVQNVLAATAGLGAEQRLVEIQRSVTLGEIPASVGEAAATIIRTTAGLP